MEEETNSKQEFMKQLIEQTKDTNNDDVFVLEFDNIPIKSFTYEMKNRIENFTSLQVLSLISCEINCLQNFPNLPSLVRLDLVNNEILGQDLAYLQGSRHLQTLMLSHNQIKQVKDVKNISNMKALQQLDLFGNDVENEENYRKSIFSIFPSLKILDSENKKGEFSEVSMGQTAQLIPQNLFHQKNLSEAQIMVIKRLSSNQVVDNNSKKKQRQPKKKTEKTSQNAEQQKQNDDDINNTQKQKKQENKKQQNLKKQEPVNQNNQKQLQLTPPPTKIQKEQKQQVIRHGGKAKQGGKQMYQKSQSNSIKSGLVFPVGRIGRYLKQSNQTYRVSKLTKVYTAAILEYLCIEVAELSGNIAVQSKKKRILPSHIKMAMRLDDEMQQFVKNSVISQGGGVSTNFVQPLPQKGPSAKSLKE